MTARLDFKNTLVLCKGSGITITRTNTDTEIEMINGTFVGRLGRFGKFRQIWMAIKFAFG